MVNKYSVYTMYLGIIALISAGILKIIHLATGIFDDKTIGTLAIISGIIFFIGLVSLLIDTIVDYLLNIKQLRKKHHAKK
ncbi:hypothetical protein AMA88_19120 [Salmonella enterica subsp. enterica serovar Senftenberg]|nr:hypothetical protein [Salmonella enterica subsp. enterica serovar Give]EBO8546857.1 hypothetical protein [Salmonella enterica subsp. enterica serovar Senftenberg]